MSEIHYLFPPEEIENLPKWRFYLHFIAPANYENAMLKAAKDKLLSAAFSIIKFPIGIDEITFEKADNAVSIPYFVSDEDRARNDSLALYEADVKTLTANMAAAGFVSEIYYEAIDWKD